MEPVRGGRVVSRQDLKYPPQVTPTPSRKLATVKSEKAKAAKTKRDKVKRAQAVTDDKKKSSALSSSSEDDKSKSAIFPLFRG